jgi:hypothetical protein
MLIAHHIIPIFIISSSNWFWHICLCLTQQFYFLPLLGLLISLHWRSSVVMNCLSSRDRSYLCGFFPWLWLYLNLCVPMGNLRGEVWVGTSQCLCMQVHYSPDYKACRCTPVQGPDDINSLRVLQLFGWLPFWHVIAVREL